MLRVAGEIGDNKYYYSCLFYYNLEYLKLTYEESMYLVPSQSKWEILDEIHEVTVLPSNVNEQHKRRKHKYSRYRSTSELTKQKHKCAKYDKDGHYQKKVPTKCDWNKSR